MNDETFGTIDGSQITLYDQPVGPADTRTDEQKSLDAFSLNRALHVNPDAANDDDVIGAAALLKSDFAKRAKLGAVQTDLLLGKGAEKDPRAVLRKMQDFYRSGDVRNLWTDERREAEDAAAKGVDALYALASKKAHTAWWRNIGDPLDRAADEAMRRAGRDRPIDADKFEALMGSGDPELDEETAQSLRGAQSILSRRRDLQKAADDAAARRAGSDDYIAAGQALSDFEREHADELAAASALVGKWHGKADKALTGAQYLAGLRAAQPDLMAAAVLSSGVLKSPVSAAILQNARDSRPGRGGVAESLDLSFSASDKAEWFSLPKEDREIITPILQAYVNPRDLGRVPVFGAIYEGFLEAGKAETNIGFQVAHTAESLLRRTVMDGADVQKWEEDWAELQEMRETATKKSENHWLPTDWAIGAMSQAPYMFGASLPRVGIALITAQAATDYISQVAREGGDVSSMDTVAEALGIGLATGISEKIEVDIFKGARKMTPLERIRVYDCLKASNLVGRMLGDTAGELTQEAFQDALMGAAVAAKLDRDWVPAMAQGAWEAIREGYGDFLVLGAAGVGTQALAQRHGALSGAQGERVSEFLAPVVKDILTAKASGQIAPLPDMAAWKANMGDIADKFLNAGGLRGGGVKFLEDLGFRHDAAVSVGYAVENVWRAVERTGTREELSAFFGGRAIRSWQDILSDAFPGAEVSPSGENAYVVRQTIRNGDNAVETETTVELGEIATDWSVIEQRDESGAPTADAQGMAASVVQGLKQQDSANAVTEADVLAMTGEELRRFVEAKDLANPGIFRMTSGDASVDSDQLAALAGTIRFDPNLDPVAFLHEAGHAFLAYADKAGILSDADFDALRSMFGDARTSKERINEEAFSDALRDAMAGRIRWTDQTLFERIRDAIVRLLDMGAELLHLRRSRQSAADAARDSVFEQVLSGNVRGIPMVAASQSEKASPSGAATATPSETPPSAPPPPAPEPNTSENPTGSESPDSSETPARPRRAPTEWTAVTPDGSMKLSGDWVVVDASTLLASSDPGYDQALQPRDRSTMASDSQVHAIATALDPARLADSPTTDTGAPLVSADGMVLSGNGRTLAIRAAYASGLAGTYAEAVRARASEMGLAVPDSMRAPVLVRRLSAETSREDLVRAAELSNRPQILSRNESETAEADAATILSGGFMDLLQPGDNGELLGEANRAFMDAFIDATGDQGLRTADGFPTEAAQKRVRRAVLAALFHDLPNKRDLIRAAVEDADELHVTRELAGLMRGAPAILRAAAARPAYDLRGEIGIALADYFDFRRQGGGDIDAYLAQGQLFDERPPEVSAVLREIGERQNATAISDFLQDYARRAEAQAAEGQDTFAFFAPPTKLDLIAAAAESTRPEAGESAQRLSFAAIPSPAELAEAARQYDEVVARYTNPDGTRKPGWMKAPNGKPTNLTERQWVQVRTPNFKRWFGDWLSLALRDAIDSTSQIDFGNDVPADMAELVSLYKTGEEGDFKRVLEWAKKQVQRENTNRDIGKILTSGHSVRDILRHASRYNRGPLKVLVFRHLDEILTNAVLYGSERQGDKSKYFLAHRMRFEGKPFLARVTVEETKDGNRTYTVEFSDTTKWNETDAVATTREAPSEDSATSLRPSDTATLLRSLYAVNPSSVSKVVDENGEPLVVWHGSAWDPLAEKPGKAVFRDAYRGTGSGDNGFFGRGFYFAFTEDEAQTYGRRTGGYFLNLRNPFVFIDEMDFIDGLRTFDMAGADVAPIVNLSDKFPETASMFTVTGWTFDANGDGTPTEVSLRDFAKEIRAILAEPEIREKRDPITEALSEFQKRHGFGSVDIPRITQVSQEPEFTDELKKKGHDGVLQSKDGDEAVAFTPTQIKSATDNTGVFSARPDVRYSISGLYTGSAADYAERAPVLDKDGNVTGYRIDNAPSLQYVGTGEGNQVYGWGLYASDVRGVAEGYAAKMVKSKHNRPSVKINGKEYVQGRYDETIEPWMQVFLNHAFSATAWMRGKDFRKKLLASARQSLKLAEKGAKSDPETFGELVEANKKCIDFISDSKNKIEFHDNATLYEQTFFTNRATPEETERHLLKWYEPVSDEQRKWIVEQATVEGASTEKDAWGRSILAFHGRRLLMDDWFKGEVAYKGLARALGSEQSASEFLARAGIDGIKYPVDSYGKTVKDGDSAGWNYVSFRDDNIRVDHKWVDGDQRYSIASRSFDWNALPNLHADVIASTSVGALQGSRFKDERKRVMPRYDEAKRLRETGRPEEADRILEELEKEARALAADKRTEWLGKYLLGKYHADTGAAKQIVEHCLKPETVAELKSALDPSRPVVALFPLTNVEGTSLNRLPFAYADELAARLGARVDTGLLKKDIQTLTRKGQNERASAEFEFDTAEIDFTDNPQIVIVDDTWTSGQTTVSGMDAILRANPNADVRAITTLASGRNGKHVKPTEKQLTSVLEKSSLPSVDALNDFLGYDIRRATGSELHGYVLNGRSGPDGIRERFGAPGVGRQNESGSGLDHGGVAGTAEETERGGGVAPDSVASRDSFTPIGAGLSNESIFAGLLAADYVSGKDRGVETYERLRRALHVEDAGTVDEAKAYAREMAEVRKYGTAGRAEASMRAAAAQDGADAASVLGDAPSPDWTAEDYARHYEQNAAARALADAALGGMQEGVHLGDAARKAIDQARRNLIREAQGIDYEETIRHGGIDIAATLLGIDPDKFGAWGKKAEEKKEEKPEPEPGPGEPGGRPLTEEEAGQVEAEQQSLDERAQRLLALFKGWKSARESERRKKERQRAEEERRRAQRAATEPVADKKQSKADEEIDEEDTPDFTLFSVPLRLLKFCNIDVNNATEMAAVLRILVADYLVSRDGTLTHETVFERRPDNVSIYRKTMMRMMDELATKLVDPTKGALLRNIQKHIERIPEAAGVDTIERRTAAILRSIQMGAVRRTQGDLIRELQRDIHAWGVRGKNLDKMERDADRKINGEREALARYIRRIVLMGPRAIATETKRLQDAMDERLAAYASAETAPGVEVQGDVVYHDCAERLRVLQQYGGLRYKLPAEIVRDGNAIRLWLEKGREEHLSRWEAVRAENDALATALAAMCARPGRSRGGRRNALQRFADEYGSVCFAERLELLLAGCSPAARPAAERAVARIRRLIAEGSQTRSVLMNRYARDFETAVNAAIKGRMDASGRVWTARRYLEHLDERIPDAISRYLTKQGNFDDGRRGGDARLTYGQALNLLAYLEQTATYADNIERYGREGQAAVLRAELDEADLALLSQLRAVYAARRAELSVPVREITGFDVWTPDPLYMPVRMHIPGAETGGLDTRVKGAWNPLAAPLTPRVHNNRDVDESVSIVDAYNRSAQATADAIAFGVRGITLRSALARGAVKDAIAGAEGKAYAAKLVGQLTDILTGGDSGEDLDVASSILRGVNTAATYSFLAWNPTSMLKQMTSVPAWAALLPGGFRDTLRYMRRFDLDAFRELCDAPGFVQRYGLDGIGARRARAILADPKLGWAQKFAQLGMMGLQWGDSLPGFLVGTGIYKAKFQEYANRGESPEEAKAHAATDTWALIEECQQSDLQQNLPELMRRHGVFGRSVIKFANSPLQQLSWEIHAFRVARRTGAKEDWRRAADVFVANHVIMPALMWAVANGVGALLGDDPDDERSWNAGELAVMAILGSFGRVFLLGALAEGGLRNLAGLRVYGNGAMPGTEYAGRVVKNGTSAARYLVEGDYDRAVEALLKAAAAVSAPTRMAEKAVENWSD